jgi:hypothetical protein
MSLHYKCDECAKSLPGASGSQRLWAQGLFQRYNITVHIYKIGERGAIMEGRPDLCLECLRKLIALAVER